MQAKRDHVLTQGADGLIELNLAAFNMEALRLQTFRNVLGRDRTEEMIVFAHLVAERQGQVFKQFGQLLRFSRGFGFAPNVSFAFLLYDFLFDEVAGTASLRGRR